MDSAVRSSWFGVKVGMGHDTLAGAVFARKANYPLLYAIGDSISVGWLPHLTARIIREAGKLNSAHYTVAHSPGTGHSQRLRQSLEAWLVGLRPSVVVFNCGLHDLGRTADTNWERAIEPDAYRQNLLGVAGALKTLRPSARVIWLHTTPIDEGRMHASGHYTDYRRKAEDVDMYNAVAQWVMEEFDIEVIDVNAAVKAAGAERLLGPDGVHFSDEGYQVLGDSIAWRVIGEHLRSSDPANADTPASATVPSGAPIATRQQTGELTVQASARGLAQPQTELPADGV